MGEREKERERRTQNDFQTHNLTHTRMRTQHHTRLSPVWQKPIHPRKESYDTQYKCPCNIIQYLLCTLLARTAVQ